MKTSNFANNRIHHLRGISIARTPDKRSGFNGPEFPPLFPSQQLLNDYKCGAIDWAQYRDRYNRQLACLNPEKVVSELISISREVNAWEPVLLCYEGARTLEEKPCHRRLVAEWLCVSLYHQVPEWSKDTDDRSADWMAALMT